jgi:ribosomal protein S18 acetylase RimI-like enzyme
MDDLSFRDVGADDTATLFDLYVAVRGEELGMQDWDPQVRRELLRFQFDAQRHGYREQFADVAERLILRDRSPVGWVMTGSRDAGWHCLDIAVLADERSRGVGARVIRALQDEAAATNRPLLLTVLRTNARAFALYTRMGFQRIGETDMYLSMEWRPLETGTS